MKKLLNCKCQHDDHEGGLIYNDCVHCVTLICNTMFKEENENMCPMTTKSIIVKETCHQFNRDITGARKKGRAAEKKWKRRKTREKQVNYTIERNKVNYLIRKAKSD